MKVTGSETLHRNQLAEGGVGLLTNRGEGAFHVG